MPLFVDLWYFSCEVMCPSFWEEPEQQGRFVHGYMLKAITSLLLKQLLSHDLNMQAFGCSPLPPPLPQPMRLVNEGRESRIAQTIQMIFK